MAWTNSFTMYGGGPWGVRLMGGDGGPIIVAKLRARSKGATSGLQEGDAVMRINEIPTMGMDSATASRLLENAGQNLTVDVARGSGGGGRASVTSQRSSFAGMTSSPALAIRLSAPEQPGRCITPTVGPVKRESQVHDGGDFVTTVNTETQQQQFGSTKVTKVTREISHEGKRSMPESPLVRSSVTELRAASPMRSASPARHRSVQPAHQRASQSFMPVTPDRSSPAMMKTASPVFAPAPQNAYRPPSQSWGAGTPMQHNNDSSFTMSVGMGALAPARSPPRNVPQFKVKKISTNQPVQGTWTPGAPPNLARPSAFQPAPQRSYSPAPAASPPRAGTWQPSQPQPSATWQQSEPARPPSQSTWTPATEPVLRNPAPHNPYEEEMMYDDAYCDPNYSQQVEMEHVDLSKYQHTREFSSDDEYFNEYGQVMGQGVAPARKNLHYSENFPSTMREKIYADSAFYDDAEHKYPTIEEQIKMARKVALSLMAPQNKEARGHKMFVRRRKKADKWLANEREGAEPPRDYSEGGSDDEEKYYNPAPWQRGSIGGWDAQAPPPQSNGYPDQSWGHSIMPAQPPPQRPPSSVYAAKAPRPFMPAYAPTPPPAPAPPPAPPAWSAPAWSPPQRAVEQAQLWAPRLPEPSQMSAEQESALSMDEFERMRLAEQKNTHDNVAPQIAFSLASDLKSMKGKGGKMFAKCAAQADKHIVDDANVQVTPNKDVMRRIAGQTEIQQHPRPRSVQQAPTPTSGGTPETNGQLGRLAEMIKPTKGQLSPWEAAQKSPHGGVEAAFNHLNRQHGIKPTSVFTPAPQGFKTAGVNDYNNQYNKNPNIAVGPSSFSVAIPDAGAASGNYNNRQRAWNGGGDAAASASGNFRPINFKAPLGSQSGLQQGVFEPSPQGSRRSSGMSSSQFVSADGSAGYCDL